MEGAWKYRIRDTTEVKRVGRVTYGAETKEKIAPAQEWLREMKKKKR